MSVVTPVIKSFSPDSGAVTGNPDLVDVSILTLAGTAAAGTTVEIFNGGVLLGTSAVNSSGQWSFTTPSLGAGVFNVSLTAVDTDTSGNTSAASSALNLTVDTLTPSAPVIFGVSPVSGAASALTTTSDQLTLTGDALAGSTVTVYDGTTDLGTTTANSQGVWTFATGPTLTDGKQAFTATATSPAGATSALSAATSVTVAAGISSFSALTDQWSSPITVGGSRYYVENADVSGNAPWALTEVDDHTLQFTLKPSDLWPDNGSSRTEVAGVTDYAPSTPINISYQLTVQPGLADTNLAWQILGQLHADDSAPIISTLTQDSPVFAFHLTGADGEGGGDYLAIQALYLPSGSTTPVVVTPAGNPYNGFLYLSSQPILRGQAYSIQVEGSFQDNSNGFLEVWINGTQVVNYQGPLGYGVSNYWKEGLYEGWTPTQTVTVDYANTVVSAAPSAPIITTNTVNGNRVMLNGSAEAFSTVSIYDGSTLLGTTTTASNGDWSYMTGALSTGAQSFTATAKDSAGNVSAASMASPATISAVAGPIVTTATASAVSGEALVGAKITFTLTMSSAVTVTGAPQLTLNNGGVATYASGSGTNALTFQYTVAAGNSSTSGLAITGMSLPAGAAITDASNNAAILTGANQSFGNIIVDTNPVSAPVFVSSTTNSNGSFTIKGTAAPNTTVHEIQYVYTGADELVLDGTASVGANGSWTYTTPSLVNGTWNGFTAYDTNALGDRSATTTNNGGGVSTNDLPSPVILSNDISGAVVTLSGVIPAGYGNTGASGVTVLVFDGATQIGSATSTAGGQWTFTSSALSNGVHTLTVESQNASGNSAPSIPVSITVTAGAAPVNPPTNSPVTVAYYLANQAALDAAGNVKISDTAANVSSGIGTLNADASVVSVTLTDSGTPTLNLTEAQALGDTRALGLIANASYDVAVTDTSANIAANFDALNADAHLTALTVSGSGAPTLNLTEAQALGDTRALGLITNASYNVAVTDTSANISANFNALNTDAHLTALTVSGGGTPTLNLTEAQALGDTRALGLITNASYDVAVTDTSANISTNFNALNTDAHLTALTLSGGGAPTLNLTEAQALGDTHALGLITNSGYGVAVTDTSANISANFDALNADAHLTALTLLGTGTPTLDLTAAQALNDTHALGIITNASHNVVVTDTDPQNLTIDTPSAPVIFGVSPVSGAASALTTTSDQLTLTDDALAGSTVTVYDGTTDLGTTTANSQGVWTFATGPTLTDGKQAFTATATSPAGATSALSAATSVTVAAGISSFSALTDQWSSPITVGGSRYYVENADVSGNAPWALTEVDDHTLQFTLKPSDLWPDNGSSRTEVAGVTDYAPSTPINISYQLTVQPGLADTNLAWQILGQLHADDSAPIISTLTQDSPVFAFHLTGADGEGGGDYLAIQALYLPSGSTTPVVVTPAGNPYNGFLYLSSQPILRGQAYSIQVEGSFQDNSNGFLEVWINGTQVVNYQGPLGYGVSNYWKEGLYEGWTPTQTVTVDYANTVVSAAPSAPIITTNTVNGNRVMLNGSAEAFSTVSIYDGSTLLGTTTTASNGDWSYMTGALSTGAQSFTATAKDSAGNVSAASMASPATISAVAGPIVTTATASAVSGEALVGAKITFTLTMSSAVTVTGAPQLTLNNGGVATYASGSGTNALTFQYTVAAGNSSTSGLAITGMSLPAGAAITDASNNAAILTGANQSFGNIIVDTNPVSAPVFVSSTTNSNGSFTIKGTAAPNTTVHEIQYVYTGADELVLDGTASVGANGSWTYTTPSLVNGTWNGFTAYDTNALGDRSATTTNNGGGVSTNDLPSPVILSNDISGAVVTLSGVIPAGYGNTGASGVTVLVFDGATQIGSATSTAGGQWTFTSSALSNGVHTLTVESQNASGNSAPSIPVSITVTAGAAPVNPPTNSPVTVAYYLANQAALDAAGNVKISDTAANVSSGIGTLNADASVVSVTLTDSGTPTLNLTEAQALGDTRALGLIANASYDVAVTDTSANIAANFDALNADAHLTALTVSGSGAPTLNLTEAQALGDTRALGLITNASYNVAVTDTSANISANFNALNTDAHLTALTVSGGGTPTLNLTEAQALGDTHALGLIANASYDVAVTDTSANISANFNALNTDAHLTALTLSGGGTPTLNLTEAQALGDTHALGLITNSGYGVAVTDTSANISANFDALNADAHLTALTLLGTGTPTLDLTAAQALNDANALAAISNANYSIVVTDTGANISANFDALNSDAHIASILPAGGSQTLDLTLTQMLNDSRAISLLDPFVITVLDKAANLDKLSSAQIANFAADGVNQVEATDSDLSLTLAQRKALGANDVSVLQPYSGGTTETLSYNDNGGVSTIFYQGLTGLAYTSYTVSYASNGAPSSATYGNGMEETWTYNSNGTTLLNFTSVTGRAYTAYSALYAANGKPISASYSNGIAETWTYNSDGSYRVASSGISNGTYNSQTSLYNIANALIANATNYDSGDGVLSLSLSGATVSAATGTLTISYGADTFAVTSHAKEAIYATGRSAEVFSFGSGFGDDTLVGFATASAGSDVLSLKLNMFNGLSSANTASQNAAILLSDHAMAQSGSSVTITDLHGDVLSLASATTAMLTQYANNAFKFG